MGRRGFFSSVYGKFRAQSDCGRAAFDTKPTNDLKCTLLERNQRRYAAKPSRSCETGHRYLWPSVEAAAVFVGHEFEFVITVCNRAREECPVFSEPRRGSIAVRGSCPRSCKREEAPPCLSQFAGQDSCPCNGVSRRGRLCSREATRLSRTVVQLKSMQRE